MQHFVLVHIRIRAVYRLLDGIINGWLHPILDVNLIADLLGLRPLARTCSFVPIL